MENEDRAPPDLQKSLYPVLRVFHFHRHQHHYFQRPLSGPQEPPHGARGAPEWDEACVGGRALS